MTFGGPTRTRRVFSAIAAVWIQRVLEIGNHRASQTGSRPFHLHAPCCKLHTEKSAGPGSSPTRYPVPKATPNTGCNIRRTRPPCSKSFKDFGLGSCLRSCGVLAVSSQLAFRGALWQAAVASCSQAKDYLEGALVQDRDSDCFVFPLKQSLLSRRTAPGTRTTRQARSMRCSPAAAPSTLKTGCGNVATPVRFCCGFSRTLGKRLLLRASVKEGNDASGKFMGAASWRRFRLKAPCNSSGLRRAPVSDADRKCHPRVARKLAPSSRRGPRCVS